MKKANEFTTLKNLGAVSLGEGTVLKLEVSSNGEKALLNIRKWVKDGTVPTSKGIALDLDNEEALLAIYNAIGIALDKPAKVKAPAPAPAKPELSKNAKRKLERYGVTV